MTRRDGDEHAAAPLIALPPSDAFDGSRRIYQIAYATVVRQPLRRCRIHYRTLLTMVTIGAIAGYALLTERDKFQVDFDHNEKTPNVGCSLPRLDPWDAKIQAYIRQKPAVIVCERVQPQLTWLDSDRQRIYFNASELATGGWQPADLTCRYRCLGKRFNDDFHVEYRNWTELQNDTFIACEMIQVQCRLNKTDAPIKNDKNGKEIPLYDYAHIQIIPVDAKFQSESKSKPFLDRPNIVMFIIDSMSHSSWLRELPTFTNSLKRRYDSFIFDGLVKVGLNSFPNAMAFFTGKITEAQNKRNTSELPTDKNQHHDNWPLIHKAYEKEGYTALFSEDYVNFQLFTSYNRQGFLQMPADHYYRPYVIHVTKNSLVKSSPYCFGNYIRQNAQQLNYFEQFIKKYLNSTGDVTPETKFPRSNKPTRRRPIFAMNWMSEQSHDSIDISASDNEFTRLFERLEPLLLNDSFVFVLSDHGHRFSAIRKTEIGRIEEQMPFFSMHVPPRLMERYPKLRRTIRTNTQRLSTWWDLYVTLREILDLGTTDHWDELTNSRQSIKRFRNDYGTVRGYSFLHALPYDRSCQSADIPAEYCVCDAEQPVDNGDPIVRAASAHLVQHLNDLLANGTNNESKLCEVLSLTKIDHATKYVPKNSTVTHYRTVVKVAPSDGLFEGTVQKNEEQYTVVGDVSRLNAYGSQSACTLSHILKLYCYCKK